MHQNGFNFSPVVEPPQPFDRGCTFVRRLVNTGQRRCQGGLVSQGSPQDLGKRREFFEVAALAIKALPDLTGPEGRLTGEEGGDIIGAEIETKPRSTRFGDPAERHGYRLLHWIHCALIDFD